MRRKTRCELEGRIAELEGEVAARWRAEQDLVKRTVELQRSNAELEQFASVAAHDLQEPLRMVSSYTQLLAKRYGTKLDGDAHEFIGFAVDGVKRMQALIQNLLSVSRLDGAAKRFMPVRCEAVLQTALLNLSAAIRESGAVVTHAPLPLVQGDDGELVRLFQNLIGNAVKYRGMGVPAVHIDCSRQGDCWLFSVRDNGIGIDPQARERIFGLFQRLHGQADYPGSGMGLAICKKIVERHGGKIWLEPEVGAGAHFQFTLPLLSDIEFATEARG